MSTLKILQEEQKPWIQHNFGERPSWQPLLGIIEEVGELAHAHLKLAQGIRTNEDHYANTRDAIGDTVIYLADYCTTQGFDLDEIVRETWDKVKRRDWQKNKVNGQVQPGGQPRDGQ